MAALPDLGEPAEESDWRALVEAGLKGARWEKLVGQTADGVPLAPLYREADFPTTSDVSGFPGAAPFVRGARAGGAWTIRQRFAHPDPEQTNREILADLAGGVAGIELAIDPLGVEGVAIKSADDLNLVLADVILEAAPVSLDAGARNLWAAELLAAKLKGSAGADVAFNVDPIGALMRTGAMGRDDVANATRLARTAHDAMPAATALRIDIRPVHEAGATDAQEIAAALSTGIFYLRAMTDAGLSIADAGAPLLFTLSVDADILVNAAKLRALRLCWARVMEASGAAAEARAARLHAVTSRRMLTRYDAWTNIVRISTAACGAAIGGADAITTLPFTDALGLPTPFARRVARNTQHVLLEEAHLGHVADPAGGSWFVEKLTRDLASAAWTKMQAIEAQGGIITALTSGRLQHDVTKARAARERLIATRRETITGVTDFPLLGAEGPAIVSSRAYGKSVGRAAHDDGGGGDPSDRFAITSPVNAGGALQPIRWATPFEALRDKGEAAKACVFFANLGALPEFGVRSNFARNLLAVGGVDARGPETEHATTEALAAAFAKTGLRAAIITGTDEAYAARAADCTRELKNAGATWVIVAGKPADEATLRAAGVDQFVFAGQDALSELTKLHDALGIGR